MQPQSYAPASYCPMLHFFAWFSSPSSQTRVPRHFLHPPAFFPAPRSLQFLYLLLGLQSPLTACARHTPALCSLVWPACLRSLRQSANPRTGCFSTVAVGCREADLWTGTEQQQVTPGSCSGVTACMRSAYPIDHISVSIVRWELLSLSITDVLLPNGMQITVGNLCCCTIDAESFVLPLLAVSSPLFEELLAEVNGEQDSAHTWGIKQLGVEGHIQRNKQEMNAHFPFFSMAAGST